MAAYLMARVEVTDRDRYKEYAKRTPDVISKFEGKFIARGGEIVTLEGSEETRRVVIIEFPSLEKAKEFFNSQEYQEVRKLREGAALAEIVAIDGVE